MKTDNPNIYMPEAKKRSSLIKANRAVQFLGLVPFLLTIADNTEVPAIYWICLFPAMAVEAKISHMAEKQFDSMSLNNACSLILLLFILDLIIANIAVLSCRPASYQPLLICDLLVCFMACTAVLWSRYRETQSA